jgi:short-subunit dehydrogenase
MNMAKSAKGTALVTGASSGIGAIYADRLARRGYDLILVARSQVQLDGIAREISDATGRSIQVIAADLTKHDDVRRIETLLKNDGEITVLVNNAGVGAVAPLLQANVDDMETMIELNVTALTRLTYAAVPAFVARRHGTVINVGSAVAIAPEFLNGVYGGTKAFVLAFSLSLFKELADSNVRIQAVLPGATATNFWDVAGGSVDVLPSTMVMRPSEVVDAALSGLDQGELVTIPSLPDIADWAAYEAARRKLIPQISLNVPASRYGIPAAV